MQKLYFHIFFICAGLISINSTAQTRHQMDSLQKAGYLEIYENPDKSIAIGKRIYEAKSADFETKINGLIMVSDGYSSKRDYRKSLEYVIRAKNLAKSSDNSAIKIRILTKTAVQYQQLKIYDKAIESLDEALKVREDFPSKDSMRHFLGTNYSIRGFIYKEQFNCDIAIGYFDKGIEEFRKNPGKMTNANLSIVTYNKGNCFIQLSDYESAKKSFNESIAYAKTIDAKSLLAFALKGLAEVYTLEGKYNQAIEALTQAEAMSDNVGDLVLNQGLYKGLSENYLAVNEWANYRKFQQRYLETQQLIKISERKSVSDYLNEQQKTQDLKLSELKSDYLMAILLVIILAFLAIMLFVVYDKKGRKNIALLQKKIKELQEATLKTA